MVLTKKQIANRFRTILDNIKRAKIFLKSDNPNQVAANALWQAGEDAKIFSREVRTS